MDVIVRSNNYPVNDMTVPVSWLINDLDKVIKTKSSQCLFCCDYVVFCSDYVISVMDCQSAYSHHQQDRQILGGCLRNQGQAAVQ